ncbi:MAG: hypothetical protein ACLT3D_03415 [Lawsonibacter sp.]
MEALTAEELEWDRLEGGAARPDGRGGGAAALGRLCSRPSGLAELTRERVYVLLEYLA